jgi:hypothetical protein
MHAAVSALLCAALVPASYALENAPAAPAAADSLSGPPFTIRAGLGGTYTAPLGKNAGAWERYPAAAVHIELPSFTRAIFVQGDIDAGYIRSADRKIPISRQTFSVIFSGRPRPRERSLTLMPRIGLTNLMIYPSGEVAFDKDPFAPSENEFGICGGVEIVWNGRHFRCTVPLSLGIVFSSPDDFRFASIGLFAGREFR